LSRRANPTIVGVFVLGAIVLIISVIAVYGSGWFEKRYTFVMDFETSLDGLVQGSPVKFRGITVGAVSRIAMRYADDGRTIQTPVYIHITEGQVEGGGRDIDDPDEWIAAWVERGLRAELKSLSFVTGQLSVDLVVRPDVPPRFTDPDPRYVEIPTAVSSFAEFTESLERIRLDDFMSNLNDVLSDVRQVIDTLPLAATLDSMRVAVGDLRRFINNLDASTATLMSSADETLAAFKRAAESTEPVMAEAEELLGSTRQMEGPLAEQLLQTLDELGRAARSIRILANFVERNPNAIIFGKGKPEETEATEAKNP
jgi:paraquat-inducible protein B